MRQRISAFDFAVKHALSDSTRTEFLLNREIGWQIVEFEEYVHIGNTSIYRPVYRYRWPEV